jgi:hypothetical protein
LVASKFQIFSKLDRHLNENITNKIQLNLNQSLMNQLLKISHL